LISWCLDYAAPTSTIVTEPPSCGRLTRPFSPERQHAEPRLSRFGVRKYLLLLLKLNRPNRPPPIPAEVYDERDSERTQLAQKKT
jgi:hypothetical protein